jgi:hypothetical protein
MNDKPVHNPNMLLVSQIYGTMQALSEWLRMGYAQGLLHSIIFSYQ